MFPMPIISNTNKIPDVEYEKFYNEITQGTTYTLVSETDLISTTSVTVRNKYCFLSQSASINTNLRMYGTPYGNRRFTTQSSHWHRVMQHALYTAAIYNDYINRNLLVAITYDTPSNLPGFAAFNRNGYSSLQNNSTLQGTRITNCIYYDFNRKQVMRWNPLLLTTPVRYYTD